MDRIEQAARKLLQKCGLDPDDSCAIYQTHVAVESALRFYDHCLEREEAEAAEAATVRSVRKLERLVASTRNNMWKIADALEELRRGPMSRYLQNDRPSKILEQLVQADDAFDLLEDTCELLKSFGRRPGNPGSLAFHIFFSDTIEGLRKLGFPKPTYSKAVEPRGAWIDFLLACMQPVRPSLSPSAVARMIDQYRELHAAHQAEATQPVIFRSASSRHSPHGDTDSN